jgi:flagellar assembly protein FliH
MMSLSNVFRSLTELDKETVIIKSNQTRDSAVIPSPQKLLKQEMEKLNKEIEKLQGNIVVLKQTEKDLKQSLEKDKEDVEQELQVMQEKKMQELEEQVQTALEQAQKAGYDEGFEKGYQEGLAALSEKKLLIEEAVTQAYKEKERIIESSEPFLLELSTHIAKKIIADELSLNSEKITSSIKSALQQVNERNEIILQLSIEDYKILKNELDELSTFLGTSAELKIVPLEELAVGDYLIITSNGTFDGKVDSQLSEIRKQLISFYEESVPND